MTENRTENFAFVQLIFFLFSTLESKNNRKKDKFYK